MTVFDIVTHASAGILRSAEKVAIASMICVLLEMLFPITATSWSSRWRGIGFRFIYLIASQFFFDGFQLLLAKFNVHPLLSVEPSGMFGTTHRGLHYFAVAIAIIGAIYIGDFFYYWYHRAQHTFGFLWRMHQVHHSIREMNAWNSNMHLSEELLRPLFVTLPMAFLIDFNLGSFAMVVGLALLLQGTFEHANTKIHIGPLRYLFPDNRSHRIHHSREPRHYNRNFGSNVTLWDVLFRTAYFPKSNEWPEVGLDYVDEPRKLSTYLVMPFTTRMPDTSEPVAEVADARPADAST